jgi:pre-mRNA-splicing helicase BRR2
MADPNNVSQYKYSAMSNLVLQADRRFVTRRNDEVTGDPESLAGRINIRDMGSRTAREDAPKQKKKTTGPADIERGSIREGEDVLEREQKKRKRGEPAQLRGAGILSAADALVEGLKYRPRTPGTRAVYDLILTLTANHLGDVPHEVVRSAADAVLEMLKDEDMKDFDKKKEIDDLLGSSMNSKEFNELVNLGKKVTDYDAQDDDENMDLGENGANGGEEELDERQGVAVVFDESDEDEDGVARTFEVRDGERSSDEEDDDDGEDQPGLEESATAGEAGINRDEEEVDVADGEGMILDGQPDDASAQRPRGGDGPQVTVHDIDVYWLQREIGSVYQDPHIQQSKTQETLEIMEGVSPDGEEKPLRDIENELMELFDYEHPELVGKFVANRDMIVWVTKWRRVAEDDDARALVEGEMITAGHRSILDEIRPRRSELI